MIAENQLRTGAWYGDYPLKLDFPAECDVTFLFPRTPPPFTDDDIVQRRFRDTPHQVAQQPIQS